jgi:hypothetical protein
LVVFAVISSNQLPRTWGQTHLLSRSGHTDRLQASGRTRLIFEAN